MTSPVLILGGMQSDFARHWSKAGLAGTEAVDAIETHDCFTITEYMAIDHFAITPPGQSWQAIEDGRITRSGDIPINPGGSATTIASFVVGV